MPGKEEHQFVPDALSRLCVNNVPTVTSSMIVALRPVMILPPDIRDRLARVHNPKVGHWGLDIGKRRIRERRNRQGGRDITDCMISEFIRQYQACEVMNRMKLQIKAHRFTCASYDPFEVLHLDHIGPLCDLIAHTVLLYVLFCRTYMYCTLYILYIEPYSLERVDITPKVFTN